jgi:hypothetical protein
MMFQVWIFLRFPFSMLAIEKLANLHFVLRFPRQDEGQAENHGPGSRHHCLVGCCAGVPPCFFGYLDQQDPITMFVQLYCTVDLIRIQYKMEY